MCDYSLHHVKSRACKGRRQGSRPRNFGTGTRGFAAPEDATARQSACLPGTELAFAQAAGLYGIGPVIGWEAKTINHKTAIFRQINKDAAAGASRRTRVS